MKAACLAVLALLLFLPGPGLAADRRLDALRDELEGITEALSAQVKLLAIYEREEKSEQYESTKRYIGELIESQRKVLDQIAAVLGLESASGRKVEPPAIGFGGKLRVRKPGPPIPGGGEVAMALDWLVRHQDRDGYWDCDGFDRSCGQCSGGGYALYDPGVTGLATLAFLGAGQTHKSGAHAETVARALRYLKQIQDPEGCFGPRTSNHFTYNTAICTLAVCEAYGMTKSPLFAQTSQLGVDFLHKCQNPYLAWRYGVRPGDNDTSVTGWAVAALKSAKIAGLRVDDGTFAGARAWIDKVTEPEYGRVGYTARGTGPARRQDRMDEFPSDKSESLTAEGILIRIFTGEDPVRSEMVLKGTDLVLECLPSWNRKDGSIDMYYWYWGSLAMFQVGGNAWTAWSKALKPAIVGGQRTDGPARGSWDPVGAWGADGGRVYSTSMMTLCMEVLDRYEQRRGADRPK